MVEDELDLITTLLPATARAAVSLLCVSERRRMLVPEDEKLEDARAWVRE